MTSVEKRHSSRRSAGHRKHSDGGYSDTSSGGSFLDETDREVSSLTDRAFRSLCIGDEAVYNDSDLCCSSPSTQKERQQAFNQSDQDCSKEDGEREELKRAAHDSFTLRVQQYDRQDWIPGGPYGAETQGEPQWRGYGEGKTEGRVSATFQRSFVDMSQQEKPLNEEQLCFLSNGATELSSQQRRSRSRVSSLIKAFNSEGYRDGGGLDGKLREWNNETSWDKSALMSIQRELSEFSTAYHQDLNSGPYPSAGPFSSQDSFYSSQVTSAVAHMDSTSSFMRSSHSKHSMSTQPNSNSNFFIHSEYSPFKIWRDHSRFPFQHGEVSGFMPQSEFPKWYATPMYKELSLGSQPQGPSMFEERVIRPQRKTLEPVAPPPPLRSTSTSTVLQKASALQKRCESELAGHCPPWKRTQSLGTNRFPSQRPSTVSPTIEMSRRVRDTLSSISDLQQKFTMMTSEQSVTAEMVAKQQRVLHSNDSFIHLNNNNTAVNMEQNLVSGNTSTTPFNISQLLTPLIHTHQETETSEVQQYAGSPLAIEHPPVRAESRGATPDIRMASYKSRATSLLFNLKDNRKRVKSTYSPTKFKGLEIMDKSKQPSKQDSSEPRDTVIDIPDFPEADIPAPQMIVQEESSMVNTLSHQPLQEFHSPGLPLTTFPSQLTTAHTSQNKQYTSGDYLKMQGEMGYHAGFRGYTQDNYTSNQLANGQILQEDLSSFTPYKLGEIGKIGTLAGDVYREASSNKSGVSNTLSVASSALSKTNLSPKPFYSTPQLTSNVDYTNQNEYLITKANTEQNVIQSIGREFTEGASYEHVKANKYGYSDVSSQDTWKQHHEVAKTLGLNEGLDPPWKGATAASTVKDQHAQSSQRAAIMKDEFYPKRDNYGGENKWNINKQEQPALRESLTEGTSSHPQKGLLHTPYHPLVNPNLSNQLQQYAPNSVLKDTTANGKQPPGTSKDKYELQNHYGFNEERDTNYLTWSDHPNRSTEQEFRKQQAFYSDEDKYNMFTLQEAAQRKDKNVPRDQQKEAQHQYNYNIQRNSSSAESRLCNEKAGAEQIKSAHASEAADIRWAECATEKWSQVEQAEAEFAKAQLILSGKTAQQVKAMETRAERVRAEKAEVERERAERAQTEHIKGQQAREEQVKPEQTRAQKVKAEQIKAPKTKAEQTNQEQSEQVRAGQDEAERMKLEQIKAEVAKTEQATAEHAKAEQARRELIKAEKNRAERIKAEHIQTEEIRAEKIKVQDINSEQPQVEQLKAQQARAEQAKAQVEKANLVKAEKIKVDHVNVVEEKGRAELIKAGQVNIEQPKAEQAKVKAEQAKSELPKAEQAKSEQGKADMAKTKGERPEQANAALAKIEKMKEESAKSKANRAQAEQLKQEPDKVEQVKTELAKAKAELAKIKEKMRGEQKEKVRNTVVTKEVGKDVPVKVSISKNEESKEYDAATQKSQETEDSVGVRYGRAHGYREADDYERVREKYGFSTGSSTNTGKMSTASNVPSNDDSQLALAVDKVEKARNKNSKDEDNNAGRAATTKSADRDKELNNNYDEVRENQYVYSESSKEFKLSSKSETFVSLPRDCDLAKAVPLERKPKPTEHSAVPSRDAHSTPLRTLSHKERAQTKQEILTSKIKAHAEKEISAIKEKGFAKRDGLKNPNKQLSSGHNIRQKPSSQEATKGHTGPSGIKTDVVKSSTPSSATAKSTSQLDSHSLSQVPQESLKSEDTVSQHPLETNRSENNTESTDEELKHRLHKQEKSGIKSPTETKGQAPGGLGKQEAIHRENSGKQKEGPKSKAAINTDVPSEKKVNASQAKALVKPEKVSEIETQTTDTVDSKSEAVPEDSTPSLKLVLGQHETAAADDSLQIMGIMVTVRERKSSLNSQVDKDDKEEVSAKEKEHIHFDTIKYDPSSGLEISKGKNASKDIPAGLTKEKSRVVQETQSADGNEETEVSMNNQHLENVQEASNKELLKCKTPAINGKRSISQEESSTVSEQSPRETVLHDPLADKDGPPKVLEPAKNKVLAETQPLLFKQRVITRKAKDYTNINLNENSSKGNIQDESEVHAKERKPHRTPTQHTDETPEAKAVETVPNSQEYFNRSDHESSIKLNLPPLVKEDIAKCDAHPSKSSSIDGQRVPLLAEKRTDSAPPEVKLRNKNSAPLNSLTENENRQISTAKQCTGSHTGENRQAETSVHIDSIAIRVVPGVIEKDSQENTDKHEQPKMNIAKEDEHEQDVATLLTPASKELKTIKDNLEVQYVSSSMRQGANSMRFSDQHSNVTATSEKTQADNGKHGKAKSVKATTDEMKRQATEEDYFQLQGVIETDHKQHNDVGDVPDAISQRKEKHSLNRSLNRGPAEELGSPRTAEGGETTSLLPDMKKINSDEQVSKQSDGTTQRHSRRSGQMKLGQDRQQHSAKALHPTRDNTLKENQKPEVKPKPKEKVSTIPEISAIADYARLKVIAAEDRPDTVQEPPPGKKEGFIPRIQTRHSRRPVFTTETQDLSVRKKTLAKEPELSNKMNKEPKALVFSTMEQDHKRTGMFKLGEKERQENMLPEVKASEIVADTEKIHTQDLKESSRPIPAPLKNPGSRNTQGLNQDAEQSVYQPHDPAMLTATLASSVNSKTRNTSLSQHLDQRVNSIQAERSEEALFAPKAEGRPHVDKMSPQQTTGQMYNVEKRTDQRQDLVEEERRASQREEERRTKDREAIAARIEERREKQREVERRAEEERRLAQIEERRLAQIEERRLAQIEERRLAQIEERRLAQIEERRLAQIEEERRLAQIEEERRLAQIEEERRAKQIEEERRIKEIEERRAAQIEEERRIKEIEERRLAQIEEEKRAKQREERRAKLAEERRLAQIEEERRAAQIEEERRAKQREEERRIKEIEERRAALIEEEKRAKQREEERRIKEIEERRAKLAEERRLAQIEEERRIKEIEERRLAQIEEERRIKEIEERRLAQIEEERRLAQIEEEKRAKQREEERRIKEIEERRAKLAEERRLAQIEEERRIKEIEERRLAQIEEERRIKEIEERRLAQIEEERKIKEIEERRLAQIEEERRLAQIEEEKRAKQREEERRIKEIEERRAKLAEERRLAQIEEERRIKEIEERRLTQIEEERRIKEIEERRLAQIEEERRLAQIEEERKAAEMEERRAAQMEEERRAAQKEEERRAAEMEEKRRAAQMEEERRRAAQKEERRAAQMEEERRRAAQMEEERRAAQMEEERRAAQMEEERRRAAQMEEEKRRAAQMEEERRAAQMEEERRAAQMEEERRRAAQKEEERRAAQMEEERRRAAQMEEERRAAQMEEERRRAAQKEEERRAAQMEEERKERQREERMVAQRQEERGAKQREEDKLAAQREERSEEQRSAALRADALQYYAITSEKRPRDRHLRSPLPSQRRVDPPAVEPAEDSGSYGRPRAPPSPAPTAPRSNTSSPALGAKPTMFKVKDNTFRGSSLTKSVKPRFHKSFGEDFRVGSPLESWRGSDRGEEEQDRMRHSAGTPIHHDAVVGSNRLPGVKESLNLQPTSSSQEYPLLEHRPYSRRSLALDEDDSRSVVSNMSEDVESFATSAADLSELRGLYDYERPESACSFSSDVSRSLGKPPTVPPKSEKALRRAKRLTTRRIKKELTKAVDGPTPVEQPLRAVSVGPSSPTELRSSSRHARASPHFSSPISLAHAPTLASGVPSSQTEPRSSHRSFHASPHATAPVSLPVPSPHVTTPVSLPVPSPHHTPPVSLPATPKTVGDVPSSSALHHANHPAPVTQYHVEPSYAQSFPVTQRKVLQDPGSGQYFVVDMPVQVKTKTFFDPETGKYVQLNVRQSAQSGSIPRSQPAYSQPQLQPQLQAQPQPHSQASPAGKPYVLYQGYQGYPQGCQPLPISSLPPRRSSSGMSVSSTLSQDPESARGSQSYGYQNNERAQSSQGHSYSPENAPYMDTASDTDKPHNVNTAYNTHSQLGSVNKNDSSAHTRLQPRDIITMSELEDFMDVSDW